MYSYTRSQKLDFLFGIIFSLGMMFLFHETFLDEWLAGHFYQDSKWVYRDSFLLEKIFHKGGVIFIIVALSLAIFRYLYLWKLKKNRFERDYLGFIILGSVLTILSVFFLKRITTLPCPWSSQAFGGGVPKPALWHAFTPGMGHGHCFPGGHSSGGYAFLSVYFGYTFIFGKRNWITLLPGVMIGLLFGITQQLRGAHFLSHDFATIFVSIISCWITSLIYSYYNNRHES